MKKKLIAHAAAIALFFTTAFCGIGVPVHATEDTSEALPEIVSQDHEFYRDPETGHIGMVENNVAAYSARGGSDVKPNSAALYSYWPTSEDGGSGGISEIKSTYPSTRSQNPYGTCWAHAAAATAEFDLVKNHGVSKSNADVSELQLTYLNYNTPYELAGLDGDSINISPDALYNYLNIGGNLYYSMHTMAQWKSFNFESDLPYSAARSNPAAYIKNWNEREYNYHNAAQLRNVRYLDIANNPNAVKEAIQKYGAVYISYYHDSYYYNSTYNTYYNNDSTTGTNHDVVIVGWDDKVSKYKFKETPSRNGAWLVRNSWSTNSDSGSEYTYFYMSYDDASLAPTAYALDFEKGSSEDNLYQHDGSNTHTYVKTTSVANVFTTQSENSDTCQRLDSVMIPFTGETNVNYKVEIYTGLTSSNPKSGHLNSSSTTTGWTSANGIYTIDLKKPVYLYPGEKFAIVVTALNGSTYFDIESSREISYYEWIDEETRVKRYWFDTVASIDAGESFVYNGNTYIDAIKYDSNADTGNVCIKGITTNTSTTKHKITYYLNGGTNNSANPSGYLSTQTGKFTLKKPTRSGYHFVGWYSDSAYTKKVTSINYDSKTDVKLYAKWCKNSNPSETTIAKRATTSANGSYKTECSTCGITKGTYTAYAATSVKLSSTRPVYSGKTISPYPVIKDSKGNKLKNGTDYTYKYNKSSRKSVGRYYVTVTFKGKYYGTKKLYFNIVPKAPSSASAKLYGYDDVKVSWKKSTGAAGYYVYYKTSGATKYSKYKYTSKTYLKFSNLSDNVKYNFKIIPYYKANGKTYKSTKYKVVSARTLKKLAQPSIKRVSGGRLSLNWKNISGASGYQVYWAASKNGKYNKLCDYSNQYTGVSFSVGKGKTYYYKVRAYKKVGKTKIYGPFSTPKAFKR